MSKILLTKEKAKTLLDYYRAIFAEIEVYQSEILFAIFGYVRLGRPLKFRGHTLNDKEFLAIFAQFLDKPEKHEELLQAGKSSKIAHLFIGFAEDFLRNLPYSNYMPSIPAIDEWVKGGKR
jgi:hypothetical protein